MDLALADRVVVVAGAGLGIGRATALALADHGCRLVLASRSGGDLAETDRLVSERGASSTSVLADLTAQDGVDEVIATALSAYGSISGLLVSVGATPMGEFGALTMDDWAFAIESKLLAVIRLLSSALPHLAKGAPGRAVVITGNTATLPSAVLTTSAVVNSALTALVTCVARSAATQRVGVNCVSPGPTDTRRATGLVNAVAQRTGTDTDAARTTVLASIPDGRFGTSAEVAAAVTFLLSPLSEHVNGTSLTIDGGQIAQP